MFPSRTRSAPARRRGPGTGCPNRYSKQRCTAMHGARKIARLAVRVLSVALHLSAALSKPQGLDHGLGIAALSGLAKVRPCLTRVGRPVWRLGRRRPQSQPSAPGAKLISNLRNTQRYEHFPQPLGIHEFGFASGRPLVALAGADITAAEAALFGSEIEYFKLLFFFVINLRDRDTCRDPFSSTVAR